MEQGALSRARIATEIFDRHPDYRAHLVYAHDVVNGPSDERTVALLQAAVDRARQRFATVSVIQHPHIAAWRTAYSRFGSKPSRFHSSAEALLRRALKEGVPPINRLVDAYNAVSLAHVLPVGGEDRDRLASDVVLRFAAGGEPFEAREGGEFVTVPVDSGEAVWIDEAGVTCRRWNWRQCARTALTERVRHAYFVLDALAPYSDGELDAATLALVDHLERLSPGCSVEVRMLRKEPLPT
jgi:DNA/RNA-binding domain of Phe-tRNA-synthetase-like protein